MNFIKLAAVSVVLSVSTACVSFSDDQKEQNIEQRKSGLSLPTGFKNPKKSNEYELPKVKAANMGEEVTSPTTLLVLFQGSWIDDQDSHPAKIKLEQPDLVENFPAFIDEGIQSFAKLNNLTLNKTATGYNVTQTTQQEVGFWFFEEMVDVERFTYNITVNMQEHGRSGEVYIDILSYEKIDEELAPNYSVRQSKEIHAVKTLNDLMLELDYIYRVKLLKERASLDITLELVKNVSGNYVISTQQDMKYAWSQVEDIIEELGFEIDESDEELHVFDVIYSKSSGSFWQRLFHSDRSGKLKIEPGDYEVVLSSSTTGIHISFRSKKGSFLDKASMQQVYKLMLEIVKEDEAEL